MRDYDPTTGRYLQADPLGLVDGASVYGYAGQNPLRWVDPGGERTIHLTGGGWIIDPDWTVDNRLPPKVGTRWDHKCSDAQLVFHRPSAADPRSHWHYYPGGERTAKTRDVDRWRDFYGADHLYPPYQINVEDCPCDGGQVDAWSAFGFGIIALLLLLGTEGGAGVVILLP
jgi:hypothetical protein